MPARLNHTIVVARDKDASALFLAEMLGLPQPLHLGPFAVVTVGDRLTLDYIESDSDIVPQHYAFLVEESEFDEIFARIVQHRMQYWADPGRREAGAINRWDDGRGLYFDDPNGHLLEIITRPYGSAGTEAQNPHPLIAAKIEASNHDSHENVARRGEGPGGSAHAGAERPRSAPGAKSNR
jgi:catechol 2,3-dioxygenase-like lactoylglutathione lyase family enzyme